MDALVLPQRPSILQECRACIDIPEDDRKLIAQLDRTAEAARRPSCEVSFNSDKADAVMIHHKVAIRKGNPPEELTLRY